MRSIGIDLGTTSIKGAVLNLDTRALEHVTRQPFPDRVPGLPRLHYEVDPQAVVDATRDVLEALLAHAPDCQSARHASPSSYCDRSAKPCASGRGNMCS